MRVLVVSNMYPSEASPKFGSFVADSVRSLEGAGCNVTLAVVGDPRTGGLHNAWKYLVLLGRVTLAAFRGGYDAVHAHYLFPTGAAAVIAARWRGVPLLTFSHGSDVLLADWRWPVGTLTEWAARAADVVVVPTTEHGRLVAERFSLPAERIVVAPVGVDTERFTPGDRAAERAKLGIAADQRLLAFMGALDANKGEGCEDILRALADPALAHVRLAVIGEGPRRQRLESLAAELGVADRVSFSGYLARERTLAWQRAADVVVVPSRRESLGLVALEAAAVGTPVVATRVGGLPEHVLPGRTGELYEPGDVAGLIVALGRVFEREARGLRVEGFDSERWSLSATGERLVQVTQDAIDAKRSR